MGEELEVRLLRLERLFNLKEEEEEQQQQQQQQQKKEGGDSESSTTHLSLAERIANVESKFARKSDEISKFTQKYSQLSSLIETGVLPTDGKVQLVLSSAKDIQKLADMLKEVEELKGYINTPNIQGFSSFLLFIFFIFSSFSSSFLHFLHFFFIFFFKNK